MKFIRTKDVTEEKKLHELQKRNGTELNFRNKSWQIKWRSLTKLKGNITSKFSSLTSKLSKITLNSSSITSKLSKITSKFKKKPPLQSHQPNFSPQTWTNYLPSWYYISNLHPINQHHEKLLNENPQKFDLLQPTQSPTFNSSKLAKPSNFFNFFSQPQLKN